MSNQVQVELNIRPAVELKAALRKNPKSAAMIMPSAIDKVFLDLDGDGKADFAFTSTTNRGKIDTFIVDTTGNGEFNLYLTDTDDNGIADTIWYFPDGSGTPTHAFYGKEVEEKLGPATDDFYRAMKDGFDGVRFVEAACAYKACVLKVFEDFKSKPTLSSLRAKIRNDPTMGKMFMPCAVDEIYLDLDGDGKADFAFIDSTVTSNRIDTFAVDMTGNGEFNVYFTDTDENGIADDVRYYPDGAQEATYIQTGRQVEVALNAYAMKLLNVLTAPFDGPALVAVLKELKAALDESAQKVVKAHERKTISTLRRDIRNDPVTGKMLMPSTKSEIFLDLKGDGKADFAFIDSEGTGKGDTFAVDMTGNGEFNIYFKDTDMNGIADDVRYYPDGSDVPAYVTTDKAIEVALGAASGRLLDVITGDFDGAAFVKVLNGLKESLIASAKSAEGGDTRPVLTISELRKAICADAVTGKMVMPSTKSEVFLDVDGNGTADFALISSTAGGNVDTFAVDMTGNGEFNLYFKDTDFNGIGDDIRYYNDGEDEPIYVNTDKKVEVEINDQAVKLIKALGTVLAGTFDGAAFVKVLKEMKADLDEAVRKATAK